MTVPKNHIKLRGRTQFAPTSREQPPSCSAKLHQNRRAGVETRPYGWIDKPQFVNPPQGYFVDEAEAEAFDKTFPDKEKLKLPGQLF